jgi:hypothetical protein
MNAPPWTLCFRFYFSSRLDPSHVQCVDVNECSEKGDRACGKAGECVNVEGGFECICPLGYMLAGDGQERKIVGNTKEILTFTTDYSSLHTCNLRRDALKRHS